MDDQKQKNGIKEKMGNFAKQGIKNQFKKSPSQQIKKIIIKAIIPILLKFIIPILIGAIILAGIKNIIDWFSSSSSKNAMSGAVDYSSSSDATSESSLNRVIVDIEDITPNGAYKLKYEFKDENGNHYTEQQALANIKRDLIKENDKLDLSKFSDSELKAIGVLMYNGLQVEKYNEEELSAFSVFLKVDIAAQNFDFRPDGSTQTQDIKTLKTSDEIYGTIKLNKLRAKKEENVDNPQNLTYIPYGNETTPGTFVYMIKQQDEAVKNCFSINSDSYLVFAKWEENIITYTYQNLAKEILTEEEMQKIPKEYIYQNDNEYYIIEQPFEIDYKSNIEEYAIDYGLLSDFLIITKNTDFCLELAQIALDSKVVLTLKEELQETVIDQKETFTHSTLLYDYVKYNVSGKQTKTQEDEIEIATKKENPSLSPELKKYGWHSGLPKKETPENGKTYIYIWTYDNVKYRLRHISPSSYNEWKLYKTVQIEDAYSLPVEKKEEAELINIQNNHITEQYEDLYTIDEDYTDKEEFTYIRIKEQNKKSVKYDIDISEMDTWLVKYKRGYKDPINEPQNIQEPNNQIGKYPQEGQIVQEATEDVNIINNDEHVKAFIQDRKNKYIQSYPGAHDIVCDVTELTIKQKEKTDSVVNEYLGTKTRYYFEDDDEEKDTTLIRQKNIQHVDEVREYTDKDEDGNIEIGFLYVYDKYTKKEDVFLSQDAEKSLFDLLNDDIKTRSKLDMIKFLLYVYDGIDRGVTDMQPTIKGVDKIKPIKGTSTELFIKAWENGDLYLYTTGQTDDFPVGYLSEDEQYYMCYEDRPVSAGHNNIAYGMMTYKTTNDVNDKEYHPDYGYGHYNAESMYEAAGIMIRELYEGAYVDKEAADSVFYKMLEGHMNTSQYSVNNLLKTHLPEYEFSQAQKDALCSISWQYGSILGFDEVYKRAVKEDGTFDPEIIAEFNGMHYKEDKRQHANWLLFTTGTYLDYRGEEIIVSRALKDWDGKSYSNDKYTFPEYLQSAPPWGTKRYGAGRGAPGRYVSKCNYCGESHSSGNGVTIGTSGCASAAIDMIVSGYVGEAITLDKFVEKLDEYTNYTGSYYTLSHGTTSPGLICKFIEDEFGCSAKAINQSKDPRGEALEALKNGYAVLGGEYGHFLAYVPVSSQDAAQGYVFRIMDSKSNNHLETLCSSFKDADKVARGGYAYATYIIYPPEYEQEKDNSEEKK